MSNPGFLFTVLGFLLVLGPLVFVHELGHYLVGRWFGVKADAFSIGFGREIAGWTDRRGTRWKLGWLPLGGYVQFAGDMNPAEPAERRMAGAAARGAREDLPGQAAVAARPDRRWPGRSTNFLFAIVAFVIIFARYRLAGDAGRRSARSQPGSVAAEAGLPAPATAIVAIDGSRIDTFADLQTYVALRPGRADALRPSSAAAQTIELARDAARRRSSATGSATRRGSAGSASAPARPIEFDARCRSTSCRAPRSARPATSSQTMVTGARPDRSPAAARVKELGGPLKIAKFSGEQASLGWLHFVWLMIVVSINLAFINLLPIPLLDGGHLLFYAVEGVRRKPLGPRRPRNGRSGPA